MHIRHAGAASSLVGGKCADHEAKRSCLSPGPKIGKLRLADFLSIAKAMVYHHRRLHPFRNDEDEPDMF